MEMALTSTASIDRLGPAAAHSGAASANIGPNAVIQLLAALTAAGQGDKAASLFAAAGTSDWLAEPPAVMIDERRVARLHQTVRRLLSSDRATAILSDAGRRTADYILANRIPKPAQFVLKLLPAPIAARALAAAISGHAWTFAGSGHFAVRAGKPMHFEISHNPLCADEQAAAPVCVWHAAVFQRLFEVLVSPTARVIETACEASGDACCRFEIDWRPKRALIRPVRQPETAPGTPGASAQDNRREALRRLLHTPAFEGKTK
jgi:divinyl protochlorophyllide a 8-vinyl-reductase